MQILVDLILDLPAGERSSVIFMDKKSQRNTAISLEFVVIYGGYLAAANLVWEVMQLPLYDIWYEATSYEIAYAVLHCTIGDVLIGLVSLILAAWLLGAVRGGRGLDVSTFMTATFFGVAYTVFSEWMNVYVRQSWSYSEFMPTIGLGEILIGVSPLAQWAILPTLFFFLTYVFNPKIRD